MIPIKNDYSYAWLTDDGLVDENIDKKSGFYRFDTRHINKYTLHFSPNANLIMQTYDTNSVTQHWSIDPTNRAANVAIDRTLTMNKDGFVDEIKLENYTNETITVEVSLHIEADFFDMFALRGGWAEFDAQGITSEEQNDNQIYYYKAKDGVNSATKISYSKKQQQNKWQVVLKAKEQDSIKITAEFISDLAEGIKTEQPSIQDWYESYKDIPNDSIYAKAYKKSRDDLYYLLLATEHGLYPAAGIPWYVTPFGRDGLLTANMVLEQSPDVAKGVLRYLSSRQGKESNSYYEEEQGKMFHEVRNCELARLGKIPFFTYYGTTDATALWVKLLADYFMQEQDKQFILELLDNLKEALGWIDRGISETGFLRYLPDGRGLKNQSWKDSSDANPHANGELAEAPLAIVEVQGYVFSAYEGAAKIFSAINEPELAKEYTQKAKDMFKRIDEQFWLEDKQTYALALDKYGKPLQVLSSDPSHLLWCNAVAKDKAEKLVQTLMSDELFSGWGIRTLAKSEVRYNPLSYHVGSVWPHDNAIAALGMLNYGFIDEFYRITKAMFDMSDTFDDYTLPELIGGQDRQEGIPTIPYVNTCRPQAWSAAGLLAIAFRAKKLNFKEF